MSTAKDIVAEGFEPSRLAKMETLAEYLNLTVGLAKFLRENPDFVVPACTEKFLEESIEIAEGFANAVWEV